MSHDQREASGDDVKALAVDCAQVAESLHDYCTAVLGDADELAIQEHLVDCEACRDAAFETEQSVACARDAAADYRHPSDFVERLMTRVADAPAAAQAAPPSAESTSGDGDSASPEPSASARDAAAGDEASAPVEQGSAIASEETPKASPADGRARRFFTRKRGPLLLSAALAFVVLGLWFARRPSQDVASNGPRVAATTVAPLSGRVLQVAARFGSTDGLMVCSSGGDDCRAVTDGDRVDGGAALRSDGLTRARLQFDDDTEVTLDRASELVLDADEPRRVMLRRGEAIFDVRRGLETPFVVSLPTGSVEVLGTKFAIRVDEAGARVSVSRGEVALSGTDGRQLRLGAGRSARLERGSAVEDHVLSTFGESFAWGERAFAADDRDGQLRGLGELRAQKPGSSTEQKGAVRLTRHHVRVDVQGSFARTEVEEVFTNDTDDVLEGILRFPLPPDAQIERLALEVDGHWEEGAFVDRERAAAIWRGAIVNANRKAARPKEEIIWVPGPWKDPALLEWQSGGRFELRIFPIPKRGQRRVLIAYTQQLPRAAGTMSYTYPLAHDPGGSTRVEDFAFELNLPGDARAVTSRSYDLEPGAASGLGGERLRYSFSRSGFVPAGDVWVEFVPADARSEVSAWAYESPVDGERYALLALRPNLPAASDRAQRSVVFVVDRSRSMFGEPLRRAAAVVERTIAELDRNARVLVLDCDTTCDEYSPGFEVPSAELARRAGEYIRGLRAEGASDVVEATSVAMTKAASESGRQLHVVYVGDGSSTVGEVQPAFIRGAMERLLRPDVRVSAVGVGSSVDRAALSTLARAGGGVVVDYAPGRGAWDVAYAVLAATYGAALSDVTVSLPAGLSEQTPARLPTVLPGGQLLVSARMHTAQVRGPLTIRGTIGAEPFEKTIDVSIEATSGAGNAFVPRVFASGAIADLEQSVDPAARERVVSLSRRFGVASRFTSLLVLESPAMFEAFGIDNKRDMPSWDSDQQAVQTEAGESVDAEASVPDLGSIGANDKSSSSGAGVRASRPSSRAYAPPPKRSAPFAPKPKAKRPVACNCPPGDLMCSMECGSSEQEPRLEVAPRPVPRDDWEPPRQRRMVPMRRIWERHGKIVASGDGTPAISRAELNRRRLRFDDNPLSRDALKQLYAGYLLAGDLSSADDLVRRWTEKDPLDPDALTAKADLAAQRGDRDLAIRILGSVVDVRPGDQAARFRLARALRWSGQARLGCRYALASAQDSPGDAKVVARALRCTTNTGDRAGNSSLLASIDAKTRAAAERFHDTVDSDDERLSGDFRVQGTWPGAGDDLDLVIVHPDGYRVSWLGAPTRSVITATDVLSSSGEGLALRGARSGNYGIEVVRRSSDRRPVSGTLTIVVGSERRQLPFTLDAQRTRVAAVTVSMRSRLVPWNGPTR